ncbi:MAG: hypothetical protein QM539_04500 [Alphaproteobacteria bacterium]|nr:hypothetical protein [Alphaproteobacteria bacterium]
MSLKCCNIGLIINYIYYYLFGTVSPIDGDSFMLELPACNTDNFQLFLNEFSKHQPEKLKVMVLDNVHSIKLKHDVSLKILD